VLGNNTIFSTEKQIIENEKYNSHYIVNTEVHNEGIKYADTFYVASTYCLVQIGHNKSSLKVTCEVRYVKSLMILIKSFIEKNAMAALQDSFQDLMKRIDNESSRPHASSNSAQRLKKQDKPSARKQQAPLLRQLTSNQQQQQETNQYEQANSRQESRQLSSSPSSISIQSLSSSSLITNQSQPTSWTEWLSNERMKSLFIITLLLLLIINVFLCFKLNQIDTMTDRLEQSYPVWLK
ncbi:unnamed protein product, partial [Didymodactylos carnosus]